MRRTSRRPLPTHAVSPRSALVFGLILAAVSTVLMAVFTTWLATALSVTAIVYYDLVYTRWLKRTTSQNTFWGGVCGAMPVLIGWSAVTGSLAWPAWVMFGIVFFWQLPHFYALAIKFKDDYARAGIPMLPVVASLRRVGLESVIFAWLTVLTSVALWPLGLGWVYGVPAVIVGALFVLEAHRMDRRIRRGRAGGPDATVPLVHLVPDDRVRGDRGGRPPSYLKRPNGRSRRDRPHPRLVDVAPHVRFGPTRTGGIAQQLRDMLCRLRV